MQWQFRLGRFTGVRGVGEAGRAKEASESGREIQILSWAGGGFESEVALGDSDMCGVVGLSFSNRVQIDGSFLGLKRTDDFALGP